jgi:gluconokinase
MIVVVMGVVGAGKTTVGRLLAEQLGWSFADADDYHSPANIEKIRRAIPLTDDDRRPWLEQLRNLLIEWNSRKLGGVLACSALKQAYRKELQITPYVHFVYLHGSSELIAQRLHARHGHFAGSQLLSSQLGDLEPPHDAVEVEIDQSPAIIAGEIRKKLGLL